MLILCSGPDTYRAREKARDLVEAFRAKHDPRGMATDVIDGNGGIAPLLSRLAGASLFSPKKMIRADGCLAKMKIADVRALAAKLQSDKDSTIVVTVEDEVPNSKTLETLKTAPLFHYPFPFQQGAAFRAWVREQALRQGVAQDCADLIAEYTDGDSWFAVQELVKQAAHPQQPPNNRRLESENVFDVADAVLMERTGWRDRMDTLEYENAVSIFLSQARSYLRVRDGYVEGLHPYVAKKLSSLRVADAERRMSKILRAFVASRSSLASGNEMENLL